MSIGERTPGGAVWLTLATGLILLGLTPNARGDAPALRVTNLGQSSAPVEVGQPPIEIGAAGSCAYPFTLANEAACPAGTWPPLGRQWGSIEDVAGGDTMRLEFSSQVAAVKVGSTSNYAPGLRDPDGKSIPNYDVVPESSAASTPDPSVWLVTLPPLDARAISTIGYTFSVVSEDGSGYHDYPFGIRSPRYANEPAACGIAYYSTGWQQYLCLEKAAPTGVPRMVRVSGASYDGRTLVLRIEVPASGRLKIGVPTTCGSRRTVRSSTECHRRTWIFSRSDGRGRLVIKTAVPLRLAADHRITLPVRFTSSAGGVFAGTSNVRVRLLPRRVAW